MTPWIHLTKKELRLGFPAFLYSVIGSFAIFALLVVLSMKNGFSWEGVLMWAAISFLFNFFYLIFYMSYSLNAERKRMHLWLHNPLSSYKLLLAKFVSGFTYMFIFVFMIVLFGGIAFGKVNFSLNIENWQTSLFLSIAYYFILMVLVGCLFSFLWTVYMSLIKFLPPFFSFILTVLIVMFLFWMIDLSSVLFQWGEIKSYVITGLEFTVSKDTVQGNIGKIPTTFYIGHLVQSLLLTVFFFIGSAWMLERKVEV